jgi:hypothetical protein
MEPKSINLNLLNANPVELKKTTSKMNLGEVFSERKRSRSNHGTNNNGACYSMGDPPGAAHLKISAKN